MTNQMPEMPSFRDEAVGQPFGAPPHLKPTGNSGFGEKWVNANTRAAARRAARATVQANPDIGPALEQLIQNYPTMSRETVTAIGMSGQAHLLPTTLLDDIAEMDRRAQARAAGENPVFRTLKATGRRAYVIAEDLYNFSPLLTIPRVGINMYQGKSLEESVEVALQSSMGAEAQLNRLGFSTDYGQGWIPSEQLLPEQPGFWARVKQLLVNGEFSGSTEEQIIQAVNQAQVEQAKSMGLNPNALAVEQRESTLISRTVDGVTYSRPYSPGAAIVMPFTTPGTRAYDTFSGLIDATFRVVGEPIDIPLDNAGDLIMAGLNPRVTRDFMAVRGRGSVLMRDVLKEAYNVDLVLDPILVPQPNGRIGRAKGATYDVVDEAGNVRIEVDANATADQYAKRLKGGKWNPDSVYGRAYSDRGITPEEVRDAVAVHGGEQGEFFLTMEHELVHAEEQRRWFGTTTRDDGVTVVNYDDVLDAAPEELKDAAAALTAEGSTLDDVALANTATFGAETNVKKLEDQLKLARKDLEDDHLFALDAEGKQVARESIERIEELLAEATDELAAADRKLTSILELRERAKNAVRDFQEVNAINKAWDRMNNGTWRAPQAWKKYRRRAGLTNLLRPWVSPKSVTEWMQTGIGRQTLQYLSRTTDIETIRKHAKYLDGNQLLRVADATTEGQVASVISEAFNGGKISALQRPSVGQFTDLVDKTLDASLRKTIFVGGPVGKAMTAMGRYGRRARASVGDHILSVTDLDGTLDSINSFLSTVGATADEINEVQRLAIKGHGTVSGIDDVYRRIETISKRKLLEIGDGLYTRTEIDKIWADWRGYDIMNRHYWASNAGKDRNWIWSGNRYVHVTDIQSGGMKPQAFMESQFAQAHRVLPVIRRTRRLYSRQRASYERVKKLIQQNADPTKRGWQPIGFDTTDAMAVGDWTFGIWRDMQLMRGGWAARIIPEEQARFGAAGFSGLFSNPVDYFISMLNRLDFTVPGDDLTLAQIMTHQEALGTGGLRDLRYPPHVVAGDSWDIANRVEHPEKFWGGLSREYLMDSQDQIVSRVAAMGPDEAEAFFKTEEGRAVLRNIAQDANPRNPLNRVARDEDALRAVLDVTELRIAQITGGEGLWYNPEIGEYVDLMDNVVPKVSDRVAFPNERAILNEILRISGGDKSSIIGLSHRSRADLEAALNTARGYNLDELASMKRSAVVTREGNHDLRRLLADKKLDDIEIGPDMSFHQIRAFDKQLEEAFTSRNVKPPANWPVARGELDDPAKVAGKYNQLTDQFFLWFNQVPSKKLNRQPFFQQAFGAKIAEAYYYGDARLRAALDEIMAQNPSLKVAFDVGRRKTFRDFGISRFPEPFNALDDGSVRPIKNYQALESPPEAWYNDAVEDGRYDMIPLSNDPEGYVTAALMEALQQSGVHQATPTRPSGIYTQRNGRMDTDYAGFPGLAFSGTNRKPPGRFLQEKSLDDIAIADLDPKVVAIAKAHRFDPLSVTDDQLREAALAFGWREKHSSGGITAMPYRAVSDESGYGDYTDVFRTDHFEPHLQQHLLEEGDIEQLFVLREDRYPNLAAVKDEIVPAWNNVRRETKFKRNHKTLRRLWKNPTRSQEGFLDVLDELAVWVEGTSPEIDQLRERSFDRIKVGMEYLDDVFTGPQGEAKWANVSEQLLAAGYRLSYDSTWQEMRQSRLVVEELANEMLSYVDDPNSIYSTAFHWDAIQQLLEDELGRVLTDKEVHEFTANNVDGVRGIYARRDYQPEEILLGYEPIQPVARLPHKAVKQLLEHGLMVEEPRQVGDIALLLERNSKSLVDRTYPMLAMPYGNYLPQGQFVDEQARRKAWLQFIRSGDYNPGMNYRTNELIQNMVMKAYDGQENAVVAQGVSGPFARRDFAEWMSSPNLRGFAYTALEDVTALVDDVSLYVQRLAADGSTTLSLLQDNEFAELVKRMNDAEKASELLDTTPKVGKSLRDVPSTIEDDLLDMMDQFSEYPWDMVLATEIHLDDISRHIRGYEDGNAWLSMGLPNEALRDIVEPSFGRRAATGEPLRLNLQAIPQEVRNETAQRFFNLPNDGTRYDWNETGGPMRYTSEPSTVEEVEMLLKAAKSDAIEETKNLFYDLTNKSNVADALKFIFPFGDAWYEVLSRWASIMNPATSGGQSFRNVRRVQQVWAASRDSGFLSTNEYGEEVFNWPIAPGNIANAFIPNEANLHLKGSMPVSSLMFIDPTARGVMMPGSSPIVQLSAQFAAARTENIPLFGEALQLVAYGSKDEYRPGDIESLADVQQGFQPTVLNRMAAAIFDEQHRASIGNTKLRLFQSLGVSGDPQFNFTSPSGAQRAWDVADTTGTWLAWLRIADAWLMPGQPQYSATFQGIEPDRSGQLTGEEILEQAASEGVEAQLQIESILRASGEYRRAREIFGDAEADMYMIERYGILPSFLQSASTGLVERPTTWGGTDWLDENQWLYEAAPFTLAGTVPADADDTFNSAAWNTLFGEYLEVDGVENLPIRRPKSASELAQSIERGMGYDQIRFQNEMYDRAVEELRSQYGKNYASKDGYRAKKDDLDQIHRENIENIYTEFQIVRGSNQGNIIGSTNGVTTRNLMDEIINIGTRGTEANTAFRNNVPNLADVAETYAVWFDRLEQISRMQDRQKASGEWWMNSESNEGKALRAVAALQSQQYINGLTDPDAISYAKWLNRSLLDPLIEEWEWVDSVWTLEVESYPSIQSGNTIPVGGN